MTKQIKCQTCSHFISCVMDGAPDVSCVWELIEGTLKRKDIDPKCCTNTAEFKKRRLLARDYKKQLQESVKLDNLLREQSLDKGFYEEEEDL